MQHFRVIVTNLAITFRYETTHYNQASSEQESYVVLQRLTTPELLWQWGQKQRPSENVPTLHQD